MTTLPIFTTPTEQHSYVEALLILSPVNEHPILKPLWDGHAWKESINVTAPNGQLIPVDRPNPTSAKLFNYFPIRTTDDRDIVSVPENPIDPANLDKCYRIALVYRTYIAYGQTDPRYTITLSDPIDYAHYGFIKIGRIWVDPNNEKDIEIARAQQNLQKSSCVLQ